MLENLEKNSFGISVWL